jgi:3-oxoacyl-[acyl-carrier protein] reductase
MSDHLTCLITGAASGIGAALTRRVARTGMRLVLHTRRNRAGLEAVASQAVASGAETVLVYGDLSEQSTCETVVATCAGQLDWLVSNAGFSNNKRVADLPPDAVRQNHAGITDAFFHLIRNAQPLLQASPQGRVVAVSSFVAHVYAADGLFPVTAAAKAAIEALAKTLAVQLAPSGATVNCIAPGYTRKDATGHSALSDDAWAAAAAKSPMGRIGMPEDSAGLIAFLLSDEASFITGQTIHVDGGLTLA